ncbi:MAG: trypsin-like peptidase domain-containing protein [Clostridia bacterium]
MYDPNENNYTPVENKQDYQNRHYYNNQNSSYNPNVDQQTNQHDDNKNKYPSYSYPPQHNYISAYAKPIKKSGGKRVLAIILVALFSSAVSIGAFALVTQSDMFNSSEIDTSTSISSETDNDTSSDTSESFSGILNSGESEDSTETSTSTGEVLSKQEIAEKVIPSVVCIQNYQVTQSYGSTWGTSQQTEEQIGLASEGSGVILSSDGYIVTNAHVIDGATNLKVILSDETVYEAVIVGSDNATDLAVIKIDAEGLTAADFGSSDDLVIGDDAYAIGNPGGMSFSSSMTTGCVSAVNREISIDDFGYAINVIQTDAAINPGNSGGALVNCYGEIIGITSSKYVSEGYEGLGFAIPIDDAEPIIENLLEYGYVKDRAMLGVSGQYIDEMTASFNGVSTGLYVATTLSVEAQESGLLPYDIITAVDGQGFTTQEELSSFLISKAPGDTIELTVDRLSTGETGLTLYLVLSETVQYD